MLCGVKVKLNKAKSKQEDIYQSIDNTGCLSRRHILTRRGDVRRSLRGDPPIAPKRRAGDVDIVSGEKKARGSSKRAEETAPFGGKTSSLGGQPQRKGGCLLKTRGSKYERCENDFCERDVFVSDADPLRKGVSPFHKHFNLDDMDDVAFRGLNVIKRPVFTPSATENGRVLPRFEDDSYSGMSLSYNEQSTAYTASLASDAYDTTHMTEVLSKGGSIRMDSIDTPVNSFYRQLMSASPVSTNMSSNTADDTLYGDIEMFQDSKSSSVKSHSCAGDSYMQHSVADLASDLSGYSASMDTIHYVSLATRTATDDSYCGSQSDIPSQGRLDDTLISDNDCADLVAEEKRSLREVTPTPSSPQRAHSVLGRRGVISVRITSAKESKLSVLVHEARGLKCRAPSDDLVWTEMKVFKRKDSGSIFASQSSCVRAAAADIAFNHKFNLELPQPLSEEDRVMVSVVSRSSDKAPTTKLVGCMSFGLNHLISKIKKDACVEGDFYLLPERLGVQKHIRVDMPIYSEANKENQSPVRSPSYLLSESARSKAIQVIVPKMSSGFGFTVKGSAPVRVGRVKEDSAAYRAGLNTGDVIYSINGEDVSLHKSSAVAKIVRNALTQVAMDIYRPLKELNNTTVSSLSESQVSTTSTQQTPDVHDQLTKPFSGLANKQHFFPSLSLVHEESPQQSDDINPKIGSLSNKFTSKTAEDKLKWNPDISRIPQVGPKVTFQLSPLGRTTVGDECEEIQDDWFESDSDTSSLWKRLSSVSCELQESTFYRSRCDVTANRSYSSYDSALMDRESQCDSTQCSVSPAELDLLAALMQREAEFVQIMCHGIQTFSRPLRHRLLSARQHQVLFQNMEKLTLVSERIVKQMADIDSEFTVTQTYGDQVHLLCGVYSTYLAGLPDALKLLGKLSKKQEFSNFTARAQNTKPYLSIDTFLEKPVQHLLGLLSDIKQLLTSQESQSLYTVFQALWNVLRSSVADKKTESTSSLDSGFSQNRQENLSPEPEPSDDHLYENLPAETASNASKHKPHVSMNASSGYLSMGTTRFGDNTTVCEEIKSQKSVSACSDLQLIDLQERLHFPSNGESLSITAPGRHLVYNSEVLWCNKSGETQEAMAYLCNDCFVLTTATRRGETLASQPINLSDIISLNFPDTTACNFAVSAHDTTNKHGVETISLKARSFEDKCVWKSLLNHQAKLASSVLNNAC